MPRPGALGPEGRRARAPLQGAGISIWARASGAAGASGPEGRRADVYSQFPTMGRAEVWREPHLATLGPPPLFRLEVICLEKVLEII